MGWHSRHKRFRKSSGGCTDALSPSARLGSSARGQAGQQGGSRIACTRDMVGRVHTRCGSKSPHLADEDQGHRRLDLFAFDHAGLGPRFLLLGLSEKAWTRTGDI